MSGYPYSYAGSGGGSVRFKKRKSRFTFPEVQLLLNEVKKNRHILVGKYNHGVCSDVKKRKWATLTARINEISDCHREIIEIIKKWSDLKCDTKRKVAAMRASGFSAASIAQNLSPVETMVQQILQPSSADTDSPTADHVPDEDDEEDSEGAFGMPQHSPILANGMPFLPPPPLPLDMVYSNDCAVPLTDFPFDSSGTEDQSQFSEIGQKSDQSANVHDPFTTTREQVGAETQQYTSNNTVVQAGTSSHATPSRPPPQPASVGPGSLQDHLARSASLSLKEQQAATMLIGTLSRSLESLSESVQQLVQAQQQFARDTLRLQRDTLHVLRDFSSTSLALLQDKANSQP